MNTIWKISSIVLGIIIGYSYFAEISAQQSFNISNNKIYLSLSDGEKEYQYVSKQMTNYFNDDNGSIICKVPISSFVLTDSTQSNLFYRLQQDTSIHDLVIKIFFENNYINTNQLKGNLIKLETRLEINDNEVNSEGTFSGMFQRDQIIYNLEIFVKSSHNNPNNSIKTFFKTFKNNIIAMQVIISDARIPFSK